MIAIYHALNTLNDRMHGYWFSLAYKYVPFLDKLISRSPPTYTTAIDFKSIPLSGLCSNTHGHKMSNSWRRHVYPFIVGGTLKCCTVCACVRVAASKTVCFYLPQYPSKSYEIQHVHVFALRTLVSSNQLLFVSFQMISTSARVILPVSHIVNTYT